MQSHIFICMCIEIHMQTRIYYKTQAILHRNKNNDNGSISEEKAGWTSC